VSPRYVRNRPRLGDDVAAALVSGALGVGVGLVAFYFVRLVLAREPMESSSTSGPEETGPER
jgi:hypothetical protein